MTESTCAVVAVVEKNGHEKKQRLFSPLKVSKNGLKDRRVAAKEN